MRSLLSFGSPDAAPDWFNDAINVALQPIKQSLDKMNASLIETQKMCALVCGIELPSFR